MGYYVSTEESSVVLPLANEAEAFRRLCDLNNRNDLKGGGSCPKMQNQPEVGPRQDKWFSWMPWNYHETCTTCKAIFEKLGFSCEERAEGLQIDHYDSKIGDEEEFFKAVGDLLTGEMIWRGEEGEKWKWKFGANGMKIVHGETVWHDEPEPAKPAKPKKEKKVVAKKIKPPKPTAAEVAEAEKIVNEAKAYPDID